MKFKHNGQRAFSMMSFLGILAVLGVVSIFVLKVIPMYIEFNSVKKAMDSVAQEDFETAEEIKESLGKRFSISYVETAEVSDVSIRSSNGGYNVSIDYYDEKPLIGNLSITAHFEYEVETKK